MEKKENPSDSHDNTISWEVHEYERHNRTRLWYILAVSAAFILLIYSFFTSNFLFAFIIVLATLVFIMHEGQIPGKVKISLTDEGVIVGRKLYDYDEIKDFIIIYKPRLEVKNLYFEFKSVFRHRLSIPLERMNPIMVREYLLKYLPENHERTNPPISEGLAKFFKL